MGSETSGKNSGIRHSQMKAMIEERRLAHEEDEITKKVTAELEPFFTRVKSMSESEISEFKKEVVNFINKSNSKIETYIKFVLDSAHPELLFNSVKEQIFLLYQYLSLVEGVGNCIADMLILLLVVNGKDFHIESAHPTKPRIRHIYSLDDIESDYVSLRSKLNFLKYYGIRTFPSTINTSFRNDIAHLKFEVEGNKVKIYGEDVWKVTYPKIRILNTSVGMVRVLFKELTEEWEHGAIKNQN